MQVTVQFLFGTLSARFQEAFAEGIESAVQLVAWRLFVSVAHGDPVVVARKLVDFDRMIQAFPSVCGIF